MSNFRSPISRSLVTICFESFSFATILPPDTHEVNGNLPFTEIIIFVDNFHTIGRTESYSIPMESSQRDKCNGAQFCRCAVRTSKLPVRNRSSAPKFGKAVPHRKTGSAPVRRCGGGELLSAPPTSAEYPKSDIKPWPKSIFDIGSYT